MQTPRQIQVGGKLMPAIEAYRNHIKRFDSTVKEHVKMTLQVAKSDLTEDEYEILCAEFNPKRGSRNE